MFLESQISMTKGSSSHFMGRLPRESLLAANHKDPNFDPSLREA